EIFKDTVRENDEDREAYKLIMKDKERLLSFHEPVRFIFSHSALREGWDNPNVFQICTVNETVKETRKRQEIGRGLRLPVDITGKRIQDTMVNTLTVIANESYDTFARTLQEEISEETGIELKRETTQDGRKKVFSRLNRESLVSEEFNELWQRISKHTEYNINIPTQTLINRVVNEIHQTEFYIKPRTFKIQKTLIDELSLEEELQHRITLDRDETIESTIRVPNVVKRISDITGLTKKTVVQIITKAEIEKMIFNNPEQFIRQLSNLINYALPKLLVDGIKYVRSGKYYSSYLFKGEIEVYRNAINTVTNLDSERTLYSSLTLDSENEVKLIKSFDINHAKIKFYFKLPSWFKVPTPAGNYNPDWAIIMSDD